MSDIKKLLVGIALCIIGLFMFLSVSTGIIAGAGVVIGLIGLVIIIYVLALGHLH